MKKNQDEDDERLDESVGVFIFSRLEGRQVVFLYQRPDTDRGAGLWQHTAHGGVFQSDLGDLEDDYSVTALSVCRRKIRECYGSAMESLFTKKCEETFLLVQRDQSVAWTRLHYRADLLWEDTKPLRDSRHVRMFFKIGRRILDWRTNWALRAPLVASFRELNQRGVMDQEGFFMHARNISALRNAFEMEYSPGDGAQ